MRALDAVLLAVLGVAAGAGGAVASIVAGPQPVPVVVWVVVAVQLLTSPVIVLRRRMPVAAGVTVAASAVLQTLLLYAGPGTLPETLLSVSAWAPIALSISVEHITERGLPPRRTAVVWGAIGVLTVVATRPWDPDAMFIVNGLLHNAVAPLFGLVLAARRRRLQLLRDRAERAEREQAWRAEQARAEERRRLAAELHDLVAHRVTLMTLQAGALMVSATDDATRAAAEHLRADGAQALDELRELVGVLRRGTGVPTVVTDDLRSPPLAELVHEAERAGQPIRLTEDGDRSALSAVAARTAYRVVQEALTNVRKHAPGAVARVEVVYRTDRTRIVVHNAAPGRPVGFLAGSGGGTGLAGLRERLELVGGSLRAGADDTGGFRLETDLPSRVWP